MIDQIGRAVAVVVLALMLAGCGRETPLAGNPENPLEAAARDRGLVQSSRAAPTGVFERRHELGRDALCIAPLGGNRYRFALTAAYGPGLVCQGQGTLTDADGEWTLRFAGDNDCSFTASEAADELRIPGALPEGCALLCPNRASISGLRLPRASWEEADAVRARFDRPDGKDGVNCAK
jgi:hypothetical protein